MKKLFLTIAVLGALATTAVAQNAKKAGANNQPELTVEQKADKETTRAAGALNLSDAQKATFKKLAMERFTANKPLREKAQASTDKTEKQNLRKQVKSNNEKFFSSVNSMLTPEQQTKWTEHKKKMQDKKDAHHE
jgi:hypothetical protein